MPHSSQKQRVSIIVDAHLLAEIDKLTDNRSAAFEEALRLWRAQKIEEQLRQFYQNRSQADMEEEEGAVCSRKWKKLWRQKVSNPMTQGYLTPGRNLFN